MAPEIQLQTVFCKVTFSPTIYHQLNIKNPRIWWPWEYGKPELSRLELSITHGNELSNEIAENFGIRQVTSILIDNQKGREFIINGKPIMLRGAAWSLPVMLLLVSLVPASLAHS